MFASNFFTDLLSTKISKFTFPGLSTVVLIFNAAFFAGAGLLNLISLGSAFAFLPSSEIVES